MVKHIWLVYIYIYIYMYVYAYICIYIYIFVYIYYMSEKYFVILFIFFTGNILRYLGYILPAKIL